MTDKLYLDQFIARQHPYVDVYAYGAVGDGTVDDLGALQAADGAASASGYPLLLPKGTFRVSDDLTLAADVVILGGILAPDDTLTVTLAGSVLSLAADYAGGDGTVTTSGDLTKPLTAEDVTGARDDPEEALASLLTALATLGLITDSTTATAA